MATRAAREKNSHLNEHHKKILADLMGEEANMHCADCRRKGKRVPPVAVFCHEKCLEKKKETGVCEPFQTRTDPFTVVPFSHLVPLIATCSYVCHNVCAKTKSIELNQ